MLYQIKNLEYLEYLKYMNYSFFRHTYMKQLTSYTLIIRNRFVGLVTLDNSVYKQLLGLITIIGCKRTEFEKFAKGRNDIT